MTKKKTKNQLEDLEVMLTVPEAAKLKGVTEARVYQWIAEGRLTKHVDERFKRTLVNRSEVDALTPLKRGRTPKASKKGGKS